MATTYKVVQDVRPGLLSEYYAGTNISTADDAVLMSFEGEVTLTDILVSQPGATVATFNVSLIYPSSGLTAKLNTSAISLYEWSLNGESGQDGNLWYRLPSGAALEVKFVSVSTGGPVEVLALGK